MARTETHFIWTDDYADRLSVLRAAVDAATKDTSPRTLADGDPVGALSTEYAELKAEAEAAGHRVVLRGLRDDEWDDLVDAHPPRTDEAHKDGDKALGFNERTGARQLVFAALAEPKFETRTRFDDWLREHDLTRGDVSAMALKAWRLTNGAGYTDPKLLPPLPAPGDGEN